MRRERTPWSEMLAATALVTVAPAVVVWLLYAAGVVTSFWAGAALSVALSLAATAAGTAIWRRHAAGDVLFCDLLLWGWLRRRRLERGLERADDVLLQAGSAGREHQSRLLSELSAALDAQDPYLDGHSRRVARYATMTGRRMAVGDAQIAGLEAAAIVHDIGKLRVPAEVLHKPGRLTDQEFEITKRHAGAGGAIIDELGHPGLAAVVRAHHERWDGGGYPDGLAGEQIPLAARIISVADTFDAITTPRSYRPASAHKRALEIIGQEAGRQLDPAAARAFIRCYTDRRGIVGWAIGAWTALAPRARELAGAAAAASAAAFVMVAALVAFPGLTAIGAQKPEPAAAATGKAATVPVTSTALPRRAATDRRAPARSATPAITATARNPGARRRPLATAARPSTGTRPRGGFGASRPAQPAGGAPRRRPAPSVTSRGSRPRATATPTRRPAHTPTASSSPTPAPASTQRSPAPTQRSPAPTQPSPPTPIGTPTASPSASPRPPHSADECKSGGWMGLGYPNQGQCVADAHRPS